MIAFHGVKKSPLIIRIVDRLKINSEQLLPFSESEQSLTFCKLHVKFTPVSFIFAAIAQVCINLHRQHIMSFQYSDGVKGDPSPTWQRKYQEEDEEEAVTKRAIKELGIFVL